MDNLLRYLSPHPTSFSDSITTNSNDSCSSNHSDHHPGLRPLDQEQIFSRTISEGWEEHGISSQEDMDLNHNLGPS